jgi:hypothetical protein
MLSNSFIGYVKHQSSAELLKMAQNGRQFLRRRMTETHRQHLKLAVQCVENELSKRVAADELLKEAIKAQLNTDQQRICFYQ